MKVQLNILSGTLSGQVSVLSESPIEIGRHPSSHLQFDPDHDLDVSGRHASITLKGKRWVIQDRGSMNGTLVNGHAITGDTALGDTDQIRFGPNGPLVEFRLVSDGTPDGISRQPAAKTKSTQEPPNAAPRPTSSAPAGTPKPEPPKVSVAPSRPGSTTQQRVRIEVGRQTRRLRAFTIVLFVVLLGVAAAFFYETDRQHRLRASEIAAIEARTDSILQAAATAIGALEGEVEGLGAALRQSQGEVGRLRSNLAAAQESGSDDEVRDLRRQLADASQGLLNLQAAADVDYGAIVDANQRAVALIWADLGAGNIQIGTAFAVRSDGTMITCRHVVAGEDGSTRPQRLAIKFADSHQVFPAQLLAVSNEADLAIVKVNIRGGVPTVQGLNERPDTLRQGDPVAVIGFPLGTDLPMTAAGESQTIARATFTAGSVSKTLSDLIQVDGYGAQGASGSPIFDRNGQVLSILYGGEPGSSGRIVLSVPSTFALDLLNSQN